MSGPLPVTVITTVPRKKRPGTVGRRLAKGALVCFAALGAGLHWGAALYRASESA